MKILQINNCHYRRGGADVVYLNTGELLERKGHQVIYFSQKSDKNIKCNNEEDFIEPIDFINQSILKKIINTPRFFYSKESAKKIEILLLKSKPDIAHIHTYKGTLTPSILKILNKYNVPVVFTLHDYGLIDPHNLLLDGNLNICEKTINGSAFNSVLVKSNRNSYLLSLVSTLEYIFHRVVFPFDKYFDTIIAVSKFSKAKHMQSNKFNWTIDHLYNFSPLLTQNNKAKTNKSDYLLYFGRLSKEKGIETLIEAFKLLDGKVSLKIVGTGELDSKLKTLINNKNIKKVEFLGFKKGEELYDLIRGASFVVVPSEWYENNPMTIIESYSLGVPVIGSNVGGIPEIIVNGETGYTFEMGSITDLAKTINQALNLSSMEYNLISEKARLFAVENFLPETHYEKLIHLYQKTINKKNVKSNGDK